MARRLYLVLGDLHLYIGLFLSPFVLVFAVSVFYLVHGIASRPEPGGGDVVRTVSDLPVPRDLDTLQGRARVDALRPLLDCLGVEGEVDFVRHLPQERRLVIPVRRPAHDTVVDLAYEQRVARIISRPQPSSSAFVYLHKMPGPHNADVRGNTRLIAAWRVAADGIVYGVLFLTITGVYLWAVLRAERLIGLTLLLAGAASLTGLVYVVVR